MSDFLFGGRAGIPLWSGYHIGYSIVAAFLERRPGTSLLELTVLSPEEIFEASH